MARYVKELMKKPVTLPSSATAVDAAREMRDSNIGAVVVADEDGPYGIITDRDIAVRAVADGRDPGRTRLAEICSLELATLSPDDGLDWAVQVMRDNAVRRLLVLDDDEHAVGIISLGDLAIERDSDSVLGQISAAPPTQ